MSDRWTDRLSEFLDDELAPDERRAAEEHLARCAECSAALEDLRRVVGRARTLADPPPAADLWPGIAARLEEAEASRRPPLPLEVPGREAPRRRVLSFTMPQLAAAGIALAMVSAGFGMLVGSSFGPRHTERPSVSVSTQAAGPSPLATGGDMLYDAAIAELRQALAQGRGELDSSTVRVLEQNLALIERSIDESRRALAADPANPYLRQHLQETMRRKLELLQRATQLASAG